MDPLPMTLDMAEVLYWLPSENEEPFYIVRGGNVDSSLPLALPTPYALQRASPDLNRRCAVRMCTALLLALPIALLPAVAAGQKDDAAAKELAKLQGTWKRVSAEVDGKKASAGELKGATLTVSGDRYTLKQGSETRTGTLRLDPTKTPKHLDIVSGAGPNKGKSLLAIYELDGDTFRYCVAPPGKARPAEFSGKAGSGHSLFVNKRERP